MGIKNFLNFMDVRTDDDYDEDYDDVYDSEFDEDDGYQDEQPRGNFFSKFLNSNNREKRDFEVEHNGRIARMHPSTRQSDFDGPKVVSVKPKDINSTKEIVDFLLGGSIVLINLQGCNDDLSQRITDFTSGAVYTIGGALNAVNNMILLVTPPATKLEGEFQNLYEDLTANNTQKSVDLRYAARG